MAERTRARWWVLAILVGAAAVVAVLYGADTLERSLLTDGDPGREELYRQVWPPILERPLTGYGGGSFATVFPTLQHAPLGANDTVWDKAHSTYLSLWFELGLIAGSIPLVIIAALSFRAMRNLGDPSSRGISIATIAVTVVFAVHALADFSAEIMANAFLFTAVLALGAAGTGKSRAGER
jgi:O-antigen ligase